jgi:hypothetical protein
MVDMSCIISQGFFHCSAGQSCETNYLRITAGPSKRATQSFIVFSVRQIGVAARRSRPPAEAAVKRPQLVTGFSHHCLPLQRGLIFLPLQQVFFR